ncbi:39S ribosomal protein L21, mitochondrial isoform X2 [Antechinus flavipes]|uniref:39S ribosomal protein L21, mitochondrial isoform X2 n=1 Tax=Antechinus flavipes TaxID=38775 RepID=UPI0022362E70|nr:39S ribosomal protein L21, mitochondrial isoform X2 [Antechinus flavipes]
MAAAAVRAALGAPVWRRLLPAGGGLRLPTTSGAVTGLGTTSGAAPLWAALRRHCSQSPQERPEPTSASPANVSGRILAETSLTSPPWTTVTLPDPREETQQHQEVVQRVNELIATGQYGRLFAVVHFASRQWKVTDGDLILIENTLEAKCGERIRLEKVLLVGAEDFTLIGKPLLGLDLVRVEATVIEKTESWPRIYMKFKKRKNYRKKKIFIRPQTILRINTVEIAPSLS